LVAKLDCSL